MNVTVVLQHLSAAQRRNAQKEKNEGNSDPFFIPALFSSERHFPYGHKKNSQSAFQTKWVFQVTVRLVFFVLLGQDRLPCCAYSKVQWPRSTLKRCEVACLPTQKQICWYTSHRSWRINTHWKSCCRCRKSFPSRTGQPCPQSSPVPVITPYHLRPPFRATGSVWFGFLRVGWSDMASHSPRLWSGRACSVPAVLGVWLGFFC